VGLAPETAGQGRRPHPGRGIHFVVVTGVSGAGKSQAAKCLEDLGYFCVDNLPPSLIPKFAELCAVSPNLRKVAVVLDIRGEEVFGDLLGNLRALARDNIPYRVIFLDASDDVLVRRFSETRRKHPLADRGRVSDSIAAEREELKPIRDAADVIIDTSTLTLAALKEKLAHAVGGLTDERSLSVSVVAFGYKYGIPLDADLVFDVRFLPNPNYVPELQPLTGDDPAVVRYLERSPEVRAFTARLLDFVDFLLPQFVHEGKSHLTIAVGCLARHVRSKRIRAYVEHRDAQR
jgi:UPF0042 nucleotide-binding protein